MGGKAREQREITRHTYLHVYIYGAVEAPRAAGAAAVLSRVAHHHQASSIKHHAVARLATVNNQLLLAMFQVSFRHINHVEIHNKPDPCRSL